MNLMLSGAGLPELHGSVLLLQRGPVPFMIEVAHDQGMVKMDAAFGEQGGIAKESGGEVTQAGWTHLPLKQDPGMNMFKGPCWIGRLAGNRVR